MPFFFGGDTGITYDQLKNLQNQVKARRARSTPSMGSPIATGLTMLGGGVSDAIGNYRLKKATAARGKLFKDAMKGELGQKIFANRSAYASGQPLPHPDLAQEIITSDIFQGNEELFGGLAPSLFSAPEMRKARASNKGKSILSPMETKFYVDSLKRNNGDLRKVINEAQKLPGGISPALQARMAEDAKAIPGNIEKRSFQKGEQQHDINMALLSGEIGMKKSKFEADLDFKGRLKGKVAEQQGESFLSFMKDHMVPDMLNRGIEPQAIVDVMKDGLSKIADKFNETTETEQPTQTQGQPVPLESSKEPVKQAVRDNPILSSKIKRTTNPKQIKNILKQTRLKPRDLYYLERNGIDVWNLDNNEIGIKEISHQRDEGFKFFSDENTGELRMSSGFIPEKGFEHKTPNWGARTKEYNAMKRSYGQLTNVNNSIYGRAKTAQKNILNIIKKEGLGLTGAGSLLMEHIPESGSHALNNQLVTIRSLVTTLALNELRSASPTGGALGQVSNYEGTKLEAALGVVNQAQTEEQFKMGLENVMSSMNRLVQMGKISEAIETKDYSKINNETLEYAKNLRDDNGNNVFETAVWKSGNRSVNAIRIASPDFVLSNDEAEADSAQVGKQIISTHGKKSFTSPEEKKQKSNEVKSLLDQL